MKKLKDVRSFFYKYLELTDSPARALLKMYEYNIIAHFTSELKPVIVDVGCGDGAFSAATFNMRARAFQMLGIDGSKRQLNMAKKRAIYPSVILADARFLPIKSDSLNTVISISVLEHIPELDDVLKELYRILRKSGVLFFTVPTKIYNDSFFISKILSSFSKITYVEKMREKYIKYMERSLHHFRYFDVSTTNRKLFKLGFSNVKAEYLIPDKALMAWSIIRHLEGGVKGIRLPRQFSRIIVRMLYRILFKARSDTKTCLCFIVGK